jgi:hypothetical protein
MEGYVRGANFHSLLLLPWVPITFRSLVLKNYRNFFSSMLEKFGAESRGLSIVLVYHLEPEMLPQYYSLLK